MLGSIGSIFSYIGILAIVVGATFFGYAMCIYNTTLLAQLNSPIIPTVACLIISYFIAVIFMSVYNMSVDTIL